MCLYSKTNIPKIAKKDIKVYKILGKIDKKFLTPYRSYRMNEGYHYIQTGKKFGVFLSSGMYPYRIEKGLHAYTTLNAAIDQKYHGLISQIIVEMIIPKGSEYFIDKIGKQICSDNLIWYKEAKQYQITL